jgi:hypothetical protein
MRALALLVGQQLGVLSLLAAATGAATGPAQQRRSHHIGSHVLQGRSCRAAVAVVLMHVRALPLG